MCDHSSRRRIAAPLMQPTRATGRRMPYAAPIRFCSRWGLPCHCCYQQRGALLPHHFDLTASKYGGMISVALSLKLLPPDVIRHRSSLEPGLSSPTRVTREAAVAQPSGRAQIAGPPSTSKSKLNSIARHSPSMTPSIFSGRKRRWKATTAARPSAMP